jgi:pimeloyl-ACP methyl ester carboxylesterase
MCLVENRGAKIYWDEQGQGEPVLLIMGLGWASNMWHRTRPVLAARYRTIAFDNRGAGRSDATAPHTLDVTIHHDDGRIHQRGIGDAVNYIGMHKEDRIICRRRGIVRTHGCFKGE